VDGARLTKEVAGTLRSLIEDLRSAVIGIGTVTEDAGAAGRRCLDLAESIARPERLSEATAAREEGPALAVSLSEWIERVFQGLDEEAVLITRLKEAATGLGKVGCDSRVAHEAFESLRSLAARVLSMREESR
jgi:hypothetical protein